MEIIEILKAILFGVVEGITEWLPISSTGHLILLEEFVSMNQSEAFMSMFRVVIQLGAILAVVVLYWKKLFPFSLEKGVHMKKDIWNMWFKIIVACLPAAVVGIFLDDMFEVLFYNYQTVATMLILFGILFIVIEKRNKGKVSRINSLAEITYKSAFIIGLFQLVAAIFPGTSRSGATILGGILIGTSREIAAEFTFFLAIPVMFGASLLKVLKFGFAFTSAELTILLVAMLVAFVVSIVVIKGLMQYIKKHDFTVFGWYRIVLGIVVFAYFWI